MFIFFKIFYLSLKVPQEQVMIIFKKTKKYVFCYFWVNCPIKISNMANRQT